MSYTHKVIKNFTGDNVNLSGKIVAGTKLNEATLDSKYVQMLVKADFIAPLTAKAEPASVSDVKQPVSEGVSIGSLEGGDEPDPGAQLDAMMDEELGDEDLSEDGDLSETGGDSTEEEGQGQDGDIVRQEVISDTPITDAINQVKSGDKEALKAVADKYKSEVRRNLGFDNMKRELLAEFAGK